MLNVGKVCTFLFGDEGRKDLNAINSPTGQSKQIWKVLCDRSGRHRHRTEWRRDLPIDHHLEIDRIIGQIR